MQECSHLVPVFIWKLVARMSPLDPGAVQEDIWFYPLTSYCGNDAFDRVPVRELCHMDPGLATNATGDFIPSGSVGRISL